MIEHLEDSAPSRKGPTLLRVTAIILSGKLLLFLCVFLSLNLLPPIFDEAGYLRHLHWPQGNSIDREAMLKTWDGAHYLYLSEEGYSEAGPSAAFYPLWPMVIRLFRPLFGDPLWAALVLSNFFSLLGLVFFHRLAARLSGEDSADTALLIMLAYPGALYFCFPYSESLFFFLSVGVFLLVLRNRLGFASILSTLAPMARIVGVFLIIPLGFRFLQDRQAGRRHLWTLPKILAPILGVGLVLLIMWNQTGDFFTCFKAQSFFASRGSAMKLLEPGKFLSSLFDVWGLHGVLHSALDRFFFLILLLGLMLTTRLKQMSTSLSLYSAAMVLVPAITMSFMAFIRYGGAAFPVFIAYGAVLSGDRRKELRWLLLVLFLMIQFFFLIRHVNSLWAS